METEVLKLGPERRERNVILDRAGRVLAEGGIVAFPTETVYGLGVNGASPEAVEHLYEIRKRPREKPLTVHIADITDVERLVGLDLRQVSTTGRRLMERCWPGPLTIIFGPDCHRDGKTVGVRLPAHPVARELIRRADCPVLAPSANLTGESPATNAEEALQYFDGQIEMVLDAGPVPGEGVSSTVIRLVGNDFEILREGPLSAGQLRCAAQPRKSSGTGEQVNR